MLVSADVTASCVDFDLMLLAWPTSLRTIAATSDSMRVGGTYRVTSVVPWPRYCSSSSNVRLKTYFCRSVHSTGPGGGPATPEPRKVPYLRVKDGGGVPARSPQSRPGPRTPEMDRVALVMGGSILAPPE